MTIDLFSDTHMHSTHSDGSVSIREMAGSALEKGLHTITITDHAPLPYETRYALPRERTAAYRRDAEAVKKEYSGRLTVMAGLEMEYIPHLKDWIRELVDMDWDLTIASVHTLFVGNDASLVNGNEAEFNRCLNTLFKGDIRAFCRAYYRTLQAAVDTGWFDIVGHLDVLKKFNTGNRFFDEQAGWYQGLVADTLSAIRRKGMKMEINMGGMTHPIAMPYPSPWIVTAAAEMGIPLVMGSDAHAPDAVAQCFDRVPELMDSLTPPSVSQAG